MSDEKKPSKKKLDDKELQQILDAIQKAYGMAGKKVETMTLIESKDGEQKTELLVDNRDKDRIN